MAVSVHEGYEAFLTCDCGTRCDVTSAEVKDARVFLVLQCRLHSEHKFVRAIEINLREEAAV